MKNKLIITKIKNLIKYLSKKFILIDFINEGTTDSIDSDKNLLNKPLIILYY